MEEKTPWALRMRALFLTFRELLIVLVIVAIVSLLLYWLVNDETVAAGWRLVSVLRLFLVGLLVEAGRLSMQLTHLLPVIVRRRAIRIAITPLTVATGYWVRIFLTDSGVERFRMFRGKVRFHTDSLRDWWRTLPTGWKFVLVFVAIALQVLLSPLAQVIIAFPVGFMVPLFLSGIMRAYAWIGDSMFGVAYRKYLAPLERALSRWLKSLLFLKTYREALRLGELQFRTLLRIWRKEHRKPDGRLYVHPWKIIAIWRSGRLNEYRGRGLLGDPRRKKANSQD